MDWDWNPVGFIGHIRLLKSRQNAFGDGRQDLEGDWVSHSSSAVRLLLPAEAHGNSSRLPIGGRGHSSCTWCWSMVDALWFILRLLLLPVGRKLKIFHQEESSVPYYGLSLMRKRHPVLVKRPPIQQPRSLVSSAAARLVVLSCVYFLSSSVVFKRHLAAGNIIFAIQELGKLGKQLF